LNLVKRNIIQVKIVFVKYFFVWISVLICTTPSRADWYVTTSGNDLTGNGSVANPWSSVGHACEVVTSGTVIVGSGTFAEQAIIKVAPGVNIKGSGKVSTILKLPVNNWAEFLPQWFFIQLRSTTWQESPSTLSDFTIEGSGLPNSLSGGIVIEKRRNVTLLNLGFSNIAWSAVWLMEAEKCLIDSCTFDECGRETNVYSSGAIQPSFVQDLEIRNFRITAHREGTGYGITALGLGTPRASWKRVNVHDGIIDLKGTALWNNGMAANIAIEANLCWPMEACEIHHCSINNQISLPGGSGMVRTGLPTMRIHHNTLPIVMTGGKASGYGIELSLDDCEIDHNYMVGGAYFIAGFYEPRSKIKIHHNVIRNLSSLWEWTIIAGKATGLYIYNNTFDWTDGEPDWSIVGLKDKIDGLVFQNNLIAVSDSVKNHNQRSIALIGNATWDGSSYSISQLAIRNNYLLNATLAPTVWPGNYENNREGIPGINRNGDLPEKYYLPSDKSSNLVDAGSAMDLGDIEFLGAAPDIGAFEFDPSEVSISVFKQSHLNQLRLRGIQRFRFTYDILGRNKKLE